MISIYASIRNQTSRDFQIFIYCTFLFLFSEGMESSRTRFHKYWKIYFLLTFKQMMCWPFHDYKNPQEETTSVKFSWTDVLNVLIPCHHNKNNTKKLKHTIICETHKLCYNRMFFFLSLLQSLIVNPHLQYAINAGHHRNICRLTSSILKTFTNLFKRCRWRRMSGMLTQNAT